jgi:hypothetical protein
MLALAFQTLGLVARFVENVVSLDISLATTAADS